MFFFFQIQYLHLKLPSSQHTHPHTCGASHGRPLHFVSRPEAICHPETQLVTLKLLYPHTNTRNYSLLRVGGWLCCVCAVWQLNCLSAPVRLFALDIFNLHDSCPSTDLPGIPTSQPRHPGTLAAAQPQTFNLSRRNPSGGAGGSGGGSLRSGFWLTLHVARLYLPKICCTQATSCLPNYSNPSHSHRLLFADKIKCLCRHLRNPCGTRTKFPDSRGGS